MNRNFLAFLLATTVLVPVIANAPAAKAVSIVQDYPKPRDSSYSPMINEADKKPEPVAPPKKKEVKAPEQEKTLQMQPIIEKIPEKGSTAKTIFSNNKDAQRVIVTFNTMPKVLSMKKEGDAVVVRFGADFNYNPPAVPKGFVKSYASVSREGRVLTIRHVPGLEVSFRRNKSMIIVDVKPKVEKKPEPPVVEKPVEKKVEEVKKAEAKPVKEEKKKPGGKPKIEFSKDGDIERLRFTFSNPVPAAVFERFGYYWLVFYTDEQLELPAELSSSQLFGAGKKIDGAKVEILDAENYPKPVTTPLIFNFELLKNTFSMAEKNENEWLVEFDPNIKYEAENALKQSATADSWVYNAPGISGKITVKDELTNDYMDIFPLAPQGYVAAKTSNEKFVAEKTVQGIVFKPIGQYEIRNDEKDKLKIIRPSAPVASAAATAVTPPKGDVTAKPIFQFQKWPQLDNKEYRKTEQKLQRGDAFEFGKFLFSQGLYTEAAVHLQGVPGTQAAFLVGASYYLTGRYEEALRLFEAISLPEDVDPNELLLWQAATNYELSKISPSTVKPLDLNNFALPRNLDNYPDNIKSRLLFSVIEKMIDEGRLDSAQGFLNTLNKLPLSTARKSYLQYLQGRINDGQNKRGRAYEIWKEVAAAKTDRESQAKSAFEMISQDYTTGKIKPEEAIKSLNYIRIMWRGEMFEYKLLNLLADIYAKTGKELDALRTYKEMLSSFPRFPNNLTIAAKMRELFIQALKRDFVSKDNVFRAVTIYYEFDELRPGGDEGNSLTLQLADSLAQYDLLSEAAKVLQKYLETVNDPAQKAEIGTRMAIMHYLDNKPKEALEALKNSENPNMPGYLMQERKILQIRAMIDLGQYDVALGSMSPLPDEQTNRFKADIFWKKKQWAELIDVYGLMPNKTDEDIMRMAMAYVLLGDKNNLDALAKEYSTRMEKTKYAETFSFVTNTDNVDYRNLDMSLGLDKAQGILDSYRQRLKTELPPATEAAPAAAPPTQAAPAN